jgi:hypothetical protein
LNSAEQAAFDALHYRVLEALVERWNREHTSADWVVKANFLYFQKPIVIGRPAAPAKQIVWATWPAKSRGSSGEKSGDPTQPAKANGPNR